MKTNAITHFRLGRSQWIKIAALCLAIALLVAYLLLGSLVVGKLTAVDPQKIVYDQTHYEQLVTHFLAQQ
jgi:hypothetical protein